MRTAAYFLGIVACLALMVAHLLYVAAPLLVGLPATSANVPFALVVSAPAWVLMAIALALDVAMLRSR
jgi:hypothetical protein